MSNAKHTPGPWSWNKRSLSIWSGDERNDGVHVADVKGFFDRKTLEANARLIAAAPEQNAELVKLADDLHAHTKDGLGATPETLRIWEERARAAIAKATNN